MKRLFIETNEFQACWKELGMTEDDLRQFQDHLLECPEAGPVIQGTGGVRKVRWARQGKGKSGGLRIIYIDIRSRETIWLITAFGKNEQDSLNSAEKKHIKEFVKSLYGGEEQ
jgi:hypothetical protein